MSFIHLQENRTWCILGGAFNYSNLRRQKQRPRVYPLHRMPVLTFTDMTWDATTNPTPPGSCCQPNPIAPNGMHPD